MRGAAAAGAIVLAIAALYFFQYSIEHGWIGPATRVALGTLTGLTCVVASEWPLRTRNPSLSAWLGGAGVAILYASFWAASALYELIPVEAAFALMALVTAACVAMAIRRDALPIALLGLIGGFATPLALSSESDRPVPLFTYLLLLDVALLVVAHRKQWRALSALALVATLLYEAGWLFGRMDDERLLLGALIVALFSCVFVGAATFMQARRGEGETREFFGRFDPLVIGSAIIPFALMLSFASRAGALPLHLTFGLVVIATAGAIAIGTLRKMPVVALAGVSGALGVIAICLVRHPATIGEAWELSILIALVAAIAHVPSELSGASRLQTSPGVLASLGGIALFALTILSDTTLAPWPVLLGVIATAALAMRQAGRDLPLLPYPVALGIGLIVALLIHLQPGGLSMAMVLALASGLAVLSQVPALLPRALPVRESSEHAAALVALLGIGALAIVRHMNQLAAWPILAALLLLAVLALFVAARTGRGMWLGATAITLAAALSLRAFQLVPAADARMDFAALMIAAVLLTTWPFVGGARLREDGWTWRGAALAAPALFLAMRHLHLRLFGDSALGLLAIALGGLTLVALAGAHFFGPKDENERRVAIVWLAVATSLFATIAIPLQLENEWVTIGWALEGCALLALYRRIDHPGLKYLSAGLFGVVLVRLIANPYVLGYYERSAIPILNWLSYTYLVPAAALVGGAILLRDVEKPRLRAVELAVLPRPLAIITGALFAAAVVVVFAWLNLIIFDFFAVGPNLTIPTTHMPARDLTVSIAWALYALVLLGLGMWRQSGGLRAVSLALVLLTCAKVFLYDLSHLRDLYRVAALVGLALSLITVSLVYQRFVFRRPTPEENPA